jgi:hypothetical protein
VGKVLEMVEVYGDRLTVERARKSAANVDVKIRKSNKSITEKSLKLISLEKTHACAN